jgi:glycosyltransferase involved in cell wall biosynthesis
MKRPHITVINYYDISSFDNGGKLVIRGLYKALSEWFDITICCLGCSDFLKDIIPLNAHLDVAFLAKPKILDKLHDDFIAEYKLGEKGNPDYEIITARECGNIEEYLDTIQTISDKSDIIITEHVYTYRLLKKIGLGKQLWYRAQNVEYDYKKHTWDQYRLPENIYNEVFELEKECCNACDLILTISEKDAARFQELYDVPLKKILNISAGYDTEGLSFVLPSERKQINPANVHSALYISSSASMAVDAAKKLIHIAPECPKVNFFIVGSVGSKLDNNNLPANVMITGLVSESEKIQLLETCDFALNPIVGGSGLNVKMLEYFACGLPVISTIFGARGISCKNNTHCIITEVSLLKESILQFIEYDINKKDKIAKNAFDLFQETYTWRNCAKKLINHIQHYHLFKFNLDLAKQCETDLYKFQSSEPYLPTKQTYIYGSGQWGNRCLYFLRQHGIEPIAFLDADFKKYGTFISGVKIISPDSINICDNEYCIVFALGDFIPPIKKMLSQGFLKIENIIIAIAGYRLFRAADYVGDVPYVYDVVKLRNKIQNELIL